MIVLKSAKKLYTETDDINVHTGDKPYQCTEALLSHINLTCDPQWGKTISILQWETIML